jgi:hypothetical protein
MADITFINTKEDINELPLREGPKKRIKRCSQSYYGLSLHGKAYIFLPNLIKDFPELERLFTELELTILHELTHPELITFNGDVEEAIFYIEDIIRNRIVNELNTIEM